MSGVAGFCRVHPTLTGDRGPKELAPAHARLMNLGSREDGQFVENCPAGLLKVYMTYSIISCLGIYHGSPQLTTVSEQANQFIIKHLRAIISGFFSSLICNGALFYTSLEPYLFLHITS